MTTELYPKSSRDIDFRVLVFCSEDGTNDGSKDDTGDLQGATISTATITFTGLTTSNISTAGLTYEGTVYATSTIVSFYLSGGTDGTDYNGTAEITTSNTPQRISRKLSIRVDDSL